MNWEINEHKYSHISLLDTPETWKDVVFKDDDLLIVRPSSKNEWLFAYDLNRRAKKDERLFVSLKPKYHIVFLLIRGRKALGYISWGYLNFKAGLPVERILKIVSPEHRKPFLSQIYILPEERRKGYATKLLQETFKIIKEGYEKELIVESPNEKMAKLLIKLGYAGETEEGIVGINTSFVTLG
jgi:ribosomal protein S18 acetylase RimI-like enzyme